MVLRRTLLLSLAAAALLAGCGHPPVPVEQGSRKPPQRDAQAAQDGHEGHDHPPLSAPQEAPPSAASPGGGSASLRFTAQEGWIEERPESSMRIAQFRLPKVEGDADDASLVVFWFGGGGGSPQDNIDRWINQFRQPGGGSSRDAAETSRREIGGMAVHELDVSGTFVAEVRPGAGDFQNEPGYRMLAAVAEAPEGPYFIKLVGPEDTISHWETSYRSFLEDLPR